MLEVFHHEINWEQQLLKDWKQINKLLTDLKGTL
jgi:hypothetical protein